MVNSLIIAVVVLATANRDPPKWKEPGRCGTNALFVMLRMLGKAPTYDSLAGATPIKNAVGSSLEDLRLTAKEFGVDLAVRKIVPNDLLHLTPPFIVHLELASVGGSGHFITITEVVEASSGNVCYVDGGTGALITQQVSRFEPMMTGYVLVRSSRFSLLQIPTPLLVFFAFSVALPCGMLWAYILKTKK